MATATGKSCPPLRYLIRSAVVAALGAGAVAVEVIAASKDTRTALAGKIVETVSGIAPFGKLYGDAALAGGCGMTE